MAVNLSKNNLCINQIIEQKNEKITIESDEIVPDIKPDVLSIISSSGNICLHKKEVQDGKVRIERTVMLSFSYRFKNKFADEKKMKPRKQDQQRDNGGMDDVPM
jgi:hypothetical protein